MLFLVYIRGLITKYWKKGCKGRGTDTKIRMIRRTMKSSRCRKARGTQEDRNETSRGQGGKLVEG